MAAMTYKRAGVDIDKADAFIKKIKPLVSKTMRPEVLGKIGGFSGMFMPELRRLKNPVLVSSTDGVGTKILLAKSLKSYKTLGIDLVAMCANDVVVTGAEPLFFLDYIAAGKLDEQQLVDLMKGIARGCQEAGCALLGGETAELPGLYESGKFDLAGFCVGVVDKEKIIDSSLSRAGDKIIGLASNGVHSNGFSLIRKVFSVRAIKDKYGRELLKPTRIYVKPVLRLRKKVKIMGMAHITGGGFMDNIPRVLPPELEARIQKGTWPVPRIFKAIQRQGKINETEMFRTFNMGVGLVMMVSPRSAQRVVDLLGELRQKAWIIGEIAEGKSGVTLLD